MIELSAPAHMDYAEMVKTYKLSNNYETGRLYYAKLGGTCGSSNNRACGMPARMCEDRKAGCPGGHCCAMDIKVGSKQCADCETPCAVIRGLAEVL